MKTYPETLEFLFSRLPMFQRIGPAAYKADLNTTIQLAGELGNPQRKFPSVHIAGTNGKGSVAHMIASVLQEAGYKTALYTSPHLKEFRERIRINGKMIPKKWVVDFVLRHASYLEKFQPSFFEYTFGMAMLYFAEEEVDIAVIETGMGGRLDSTNIVHPVLTVITNIGLDHTHFLGDTLPEIAREKAGIIKPGIPVLIGETQNETESVFLEISEKLKCLLIYADQEVFVEDLKGGNEQNEILLNISKSGRPWLSGLSFPLFASYQRKNLGTALCAIEKLKDTGWKISGKQIRSGIQNVLQNTGFAGRWQILDKSLRTICDTGHNPDGIREVVSQIKKLSYDRLHFVLGVVEDKKLDDVLSQLPKEATYYFCKADIPRGLDAKFLQEKAHPFGLNGEVYNSVPKAFGAAKLNASKNDLVFIGGSTFVVAEIL